MQWTAIVLIAFTFIATSIARADWINLSGAQHAPNIAEIHINDDHVKVELEIFVNDLVKFERLIPDEFFEGQKLAADPCRRTQAINSFCLSRFVTSEVERVAEEKCLCSSVSVERAKRAGG